MCAYVMVSCNQRNSPQGSRQPNAGLPRGWHPLYLVCIRALTKNALIKDSGKFEDQDSNTCGHDPYCSHSFGPLWTVDSMCMAQSRVLTSKVAIVSSMHLAGNVYVTP